MTIIHFPDPREQQVLPKGCKPQTARSVAEAKAAQRSERIKAGLDPETGHPPSLRGAAPAAKLMNALGLPVKEDLAKAACAMALFAQVYGYDRAHDFIEELRALETGS